MEFYVVDPKGFTFSEWTAKVRGFLKELKLKFSEEVGELYYEGDDIAAAWDENSVMFRVRGDEGGIIELRDVDRHCYVFCEDLDIFDEREVREAVGMPSKRFGALYGFTWANQSSCRFHLGPSTGFQFFYDDEDADYPPVVDVEDNWRLFFRATGWIGDCLNRVQDLKGINASDINLDFEVGVTFAHPASLQGMTEILVEDEGYERTKNGLRAVFRERDIGWIRRFVSLLPKQEEDFEQAFFRAVWRGKVDGETVDIFYVGFERRNLRPFIQMPIYSTSKVLVDRFRAHFKGHRIDRQEYYV